MTEELETAPKVHYICQTYVETKGMQANLQVDKLFQYTTADQAQERATRECRSENCAGADAYMIVEDPDSGEVGPPTFLVRHGTVPEMDDF